jgi:chromosome segregation ATPase
MTKHGKSNSKNTAHRKKKGGNVTVRRRYRGSGASASRQSSKTKDPMDELNTIDNEKKNMIVYKKMLSIEKLAPGTIGFDFTQNPATMKGDVLKKSLEILGIKTTEIDKDKIVELLKNAYKSTSNPKIDALLDRTIVKAREQIEKYLKEEKEKQRQIEKYLKEQEEKQRQINLMKQREHELQEQERRAREQAEQHARALRKEQERIAREQAKIAKLNAEIKEFEDMDMYYQNRDRMAYYPYNSRHRSCSHCPNCSHCSHYSHYSPRRSSTKITGEFMNGVYIGETKYY